LKYLEKGEIEKGKQHTTLKKRNPSKSPRGKAVKKRAVGGKKDGRSNNPSLINRNQIRQHPTFKKKGKNQGKKDPQEKEQNGNGRSCKKKL